MKEIYLIDGYNVINYWQEFKDIREKDLEHARDLLAHQLSEFVAFHGCDGTLVYDAMDVPVGEETEWIGPLRVVYTAEHETADSWIERAAYQMARRGDCRLFVVTSDKAEQDMVLGSGGLRISAREFRAIYGKTKQQIAEGVARLPGSLGRRELGGRIEDSVARHLEALRRR